jgi:hypothetical protein
MAFCIHCGKQMDEGVTFCPACGKPAGGTAPAVSAPPTGAPAKKARPKYGDEELSALNRCMYWCVEFLGGKKFKTQVEDNFFPAYESGERSARKLAQAATQGIENPKAAAKIQEKLRDRLMGEKSYLPGIEP